jgi:hypothetical protein
LIFARKVLRGFDGLNNPTWESPIIFANTNVTNDDPDFGGAYTMPISITSTGVVISFSSNKPVNGKERYHLGGLQTGSSEWLWKTARSTHSGYQGAFPANGDFDIGNGVEYAGNVALAIDRNIFWGYNGEFWKQSQTNKWNHIYDNGLFVGQFGITGPEVAGVEGPAMMAGNAFSPAMVKIGEDYYLYHNDESYHSGVHRWKITGLNTIQEQSIPLSNTFVISNEQPDLPGLDLMKGLPYSAVLLNNTAGWTRNPEPEDYTRYDQYWSAKTNVKTYSQKKSPDLWITYAQAAGPYSVSRDLGTYSNLSSWTLSGKVSYEGNMPNTDVNSMYLDVLDNSGKILTRFHTSITFDDVHTISIYANDILIASGPKNTMEDIADIFQPVSISMSAGKIVVKYADFAPLIINSFDPTGKINMPGVMRVYFEHLQNGTVYGKLLGLDEFRFIATETEPEDESTFDIPLYRINSGGGQVNTSRGFFSADAWYSSSSDNTFSTMSPMAGTRDDALFQSERNSSSGRLNYSFPVENGQYNVILHFAEIYYQGIGNRIFDVEIEGVTVLNNYDILEKAGFNTAVSESFLVDVADGTLEVDLSSLPIHGGRDRPKLSAIEILGNSANPITLAGRDVEVLDNSAGQRLLSNYPTSKAFPSPETSQKLHATLSPNPGTTSFNILISGTDKAVNATIYNASGQLMEKKENLQARHILRIGNGYHTGIYYAIINQGNETVILKFNKQKN